MYRILSLDGGGECGIISLIVLEQLERTFPKLLVDVDLIAGNSAGGLSGIALANNVPVFSVLEPFVKRGKEIFHRKPFSFGGVSHCRYRNDGLRRIVEEFVGDKTLGQLAKKVLIPAFCLDCKDDGGRRWKPKFFSTLDPGDVDCFVKAADVAMYTSAAPTYFPSVGSYIDGGVMANNPAMAALAAAVNHGITLEDIRILSLGTGISKEYIANTDITWGALRWLRPLLNILLEAGTEDVPNYQCRQMIGDRFMRINPVLPEPIHLDDWKKADKLVEIGLNVDLSPAIEWMRTNW